MKDTVLSKLTIVNVPIEVLVVHPNNARTHSKHQIRLISKSIKEFGFIVPVLIDGNHRIVAGHGRVEGAKLLGLNTVPAVRIDYLTADQIRAFLLADNRITERAGWDKAILAIELQHLILNTDIDIAATGFEVAEVDLLIEQSKTDKSDDDDIIHSDDSVPPVTQTGDLWNLGKHRILCGNALEEHSFRRLMQTRRAHVVFTDPPYNVRIVGHASGHGTTKHREFAMASGEMTGPEFTAFLSRIFASLVRHTTNGSILYVCVDWRHLRELLDASEPVFELLNMCVWVKDNAGLGSFYRSRHELVFVFRNGKGQHRNNVLLGKYGRNRSNIWEYSGANTFSRNNEETTNLLALHPTVKPVAMVADALLDCSARGEIVLDCFLGSGSTVIASERTGRVCFGIEFDPLYVDAAIRRWQRHSGDHAIHATTGKRFDDIAAEVHRG